MSSPDGTAPASNGEGIAAALGRIPSGLFVVTWRDGPTDRAMLASWVMQAGFVPPRLALAIGPGRDLLAALDAGAAVVVNILAESQRSLLSRFGKPIAPGEDPFAGLAVSRSPEGGVVLDSSGGWLECRLATRTAGGDHVVAVVDVIGGGAGPEPQPLVHLRKNGLRY